MPIIIPEFENLYLSIPDGRNCDTSLYQMAEIETHPCTLAQKLRPIRAAPPYQAFLGSESPGAIWFILACTSESFQRI